MKFFMRKISECRNQSINQSINQSTHRVPAVSFSDHGQEVRKKKTKSQRVNLTPSLMRENKCISILDNRSFSPDVADTLYVTNTCTLNFLDNFEAICVPSSRNATASVVRRSVIVVTRGALSNGFGRATCTAIWKDLIRQINQSIKGFEMKTMQTS